MTEPETPKFMSRLREIVTEALRFWEPLRIVFNVVLAVIVLAYFAAAWPASRDAVTLNSVLFLFILAVIANVCYCAAYLGDVSCNCRDSANCGGACAGDCFSWAPHSRV